MQNDIRVILVLVIRESIYFPRRYAPKMTFLFPSPQTLTFDLKVALPDTPDMGNLSCEFEYRTLFFCF